MTEEKKQFVRNPERIHRLMKKVCATNMRLMLRIEGESGRAIKGRATEFLKFGDHYAIRISNVSIDGIDLLQKSEKILLEFIGMATKVSGVSKILSIEHYSILVYCPIALMSLERRNNIRFNTTINQTAFVEASQWKAYKNDFAANPVFSTLPHVSSFLEISDISEGGMCITTRFPSVYNFYETGMIDDKIKVMLPMQSHFFAQVEIRWKKVVRERVESEGVKSHVKTEFKIGIQFLNLDQEHQAIMRRFIRQLAVAEAV